MKRITGIITLFALWYICGYYFKNIIPYPHSVIINLITVFPHGFNHHVYASLERLLIGLTTAIFIGVHIGLMLGLSEKTDKIISPLIYALYPIPKAALLPVFIILLGIGDLTKILLIIIIVIFPVIINIKDSVKNIPNEIFYVAKSLSLTRFQMYKDIIIPAIMPNLLTSIRIGIGTSIAILFLSETIASENGGLGYYIALRISDSPLGMFTGIFALSLIGYILFVLADFLEKKLCAWL